MKTKVKNVDEYIDRTKKWQPELIKLRKTLLGTKLEEEIKWGMPVYTYQGKNVVGISGMKNWFGLWFFQGALLGDKNKVLINCQEGKTKAMRQWRMEEAKDIKSTVIKSYVKESIDLQEKGVAIKPDRNKPLIVPTELKKALAKNKKAAAAFKGMSKTCQREYAEHVSEAKREETKLRRVEKIIPKIVAGGGLNDKYRK